MSTTATPRVAPPPEGAKITVQNGKLFVPDNPILPFIEGDGTGPDIWRSSVRVMDAAVAKAYGGKRRIHWMEVYAGEKSNKLFNTWLPEETVAACREYLVSIKGPLTTPVGGGTAGRASFGVWTGFECTTGPDLHSRRRCSWHGRRGRPRPSRHRARHGRWWLPRQLSTQRGGRGRADCLRDVRGRSVRLETFDRFQRPFRSPDPGPRSCGAGRLRSHGHRCCGG